MISVTPITQAAYDVMLARALFGVESDESLPYVDSIGIASIGRGFNIESNFQNRQVVLNEMGINPARAGLTQAQSAAETSNAAQLVAQISSQTTTSGIRSALNQIMQARASNPLFAAFPDIVARTTFSMTGPEIQHAYQVIVTQYEATINRVLGAANLPLSKERVALLMMAYQGLPDSKVNASIKSALTQGEDGRAEIWFQIRYRAISFFRNRSDGPGVAKRHFAESAIFGLDGGAAGVTEAEAKGIFKVIQNHRKEIFDYESEFGAPPDGSAATRGNRVAAANADFRAVLLATGAGNVPTLVEALNPAKTAFITWLNTQLPADATPLVAADWNAAALYYNGDAAAGSIGKLDATGDDGKGNGLDKNVMVGNGSADIIIGGAGNDVLVGQAGSDVLEGGSGADRLFDGADEDLLIGGTGNDTLYGGAGDDTYVWDEGDGNDTIIDNEGNNRIIINKVNYIFGGGRMTKEEGSNVWKDATGKVVLTHNSPWRLELDDGSVIQLGADFCYRRPKIDSRGCGVILGLVYAANPRLSRYSRGLSEPKDILIRFSLYQ